MNKVETYEELMVAKGRIDYKLNKIAEERKLKYMEAHNSYIGKCYINHIAGKQTYIKIMGNCKDNQYRMKTLEFDYPIVKDCTDSESKMFGHSIFTFDDRGLFCNSYSEKGKLEIETYVEITLEQYNEQMDKVYQQIKGVK